jgi:phage tail sheath gpL-like
MALDASSRAFAVGAAVKNVVFQPVADILQRKVGIIGTYDPLKTLVVDEVPVLITSPEEAGDLFGFGFQIHRLALQVYRSGWSGPVYVLPQTETSAQAAGDITFTASGLIAGTVFLYIAGDLVTSFTVDTGDTSDEVATKAAAAIAAIKELPVTAVVGTPTNKIDITAKSEGLSGNDISIKFNLKAGEALPTGLSVVVTDMATGAGTPDIADALNGLGTGDNANEIFLTDIVHGYGVVTSTLDAILAYGGAGNDFVGLYTKTVSRPFRVLTGDVASGSAGLTAVTALGNGRKTDRVNGVISVPDSANHPSEIAAQVIGHMARINNNRAEQHYLGIPLIDIDPGDKGSDRWTSEFTNRDTAVKAGVGTTLVENGVVTLQNLMTFYHPDSVPASSNGYASMRNVSILQNILNNIKTTFSGEKWQGISIVNDTTKVSNSTDLEKARDIDSVINEYVLLAIAWEGNAWIFQASFTIDGLKVAGAVSIRTGTNGFNSVIPVVLSGEGGIFDNVVEFDISTAVIFS